MKKISFYIFTTMLGAALTVQFALAQLNIKIPKIDKPKQSEQSKPEQPIDGENRPTIRPSQSERLCNPEPNDVP